MMGSATTMLSGAAPAAKAQVPQGDTAATQDDAPAAADRTNFLAALDAAVPDKSPPTASAPRSRSTHSNDESSKKADSDAVDMAAVIAGMLQAVAAPKVKSGMGSAADADAASDGDASGSGAGTGTSPAQGMELAKLLAAAANLTAGATNTDPAAANPAATPTVATANAPTNAAQTSTPVPKAGLRQLLQMLTSAQSGTADTGAADDTTTGQTNGAKFAASIAQALAASPAAAELTRHAAEALATSNGAQSLELSPTLGQPASAAPDSSLLSASTNLAASLQPPPQVAAADPSQTLQATVGTPRWTDELGSRLALMSLHGQHEGLLNLTPEHLGPLEVRVSVSQNTANVWFGAQHADTRAALTEALPRLRELLAGAGLTLGQAGVSQQAPRQGGREAEPARVIGSQGVAALDALDSVTRPAARRIAIGLVDTYA